MKSSSTNVHPIFFKNTRNTFTIPLLGKPSRVSSKIKKRSNSLPKPIKLSHFTQRSPGSQVAKDQQIEQKSFSFLEKTTKIGHHFSTFQSYSLQSGKQHFSIFPIQIQQRVQHSISSQNLPAVQSLESCGNFSTNDENIRSGSNLISVFDPPKLSSSNWRIERKLVNSPNPFFNSKSIESDNMNEFPILSQKDDNHE
jgi:hypothetical protein